MSSEWKTFASLLEAFAEHEPLGHRVAKVLAALPQEVQHDFVSDPRFRISKLGHTPSSSMGRCWRCQPLMDVAVAVSF